MRKFGMLMLVLLMASVMAVPAFAQGNGSAASTTNWVALTAGFAIALAAGLAAQGQGKVAAAACEALGRHSVGDAAGVGFYRIAGIVHVRDDLPESTVME